MKTLTLIAAAARVSSLSVFGNAANAQKQLHANLHTKENESLDGSSVAQDVDELLQMVKNLQGAWEEVQSESIGWEKYAQAMDVGKIGEWVGKGGSPAVATITIDDAKHSIKIDSKKTVKVFMHLVSKNELVVSEQGPQMGQDAAGDPCKITVKINEDDGLVMNLNRSDFGKPMNAIVKMKYDSTTKRLIRTSIPLKPGTTAGQAENAWVVKFAKK